MRGCPSNPAFDSKGYLTGAPEWVGEITGSLRLLIPLKLFNGSS